MDKDKDKDKSEKEDSVSDIEAVHDKLKEDERILDEYVDNFYKIKNDYETRKQTTIDRKKDELKTKGASNSKIRKAISSMNHVCVNCSRKVDMFFSTKNNMLVAKCGSQESPCNLKITINKGTYYPYEKLMRGTMDIKGLLNEIDDVKLSIIKMKLDMVFEFENVNDTLRKFNRIKTQFYGGSDSNNI